MDQITGIMMDTIDQVIDTTSHIDHSIMDIGIMEVDIATKI